MVKKTRFNRFTALIIVMMLTFTMILSRLTYLQIINVDEYKELANNKSVRQIPQSAPRGDILDKNGVVLAKSKQSYTLIYMETEESKKNIFGTLKEVFALIDQSAKTSENGTIEKEKINDEFALNVNPFRFEFKSDDENTRRAYELRFKKDRGFQEKIINKNYKGKTESDLTDSEKTFLNEELMKITPEEVFYKLVKDYELYKLLGLNSEEEKALSKKDGAEITKLISEKYTLEEIRRYMLVRDAIKMQSFTGYKPVEIASNIDRNTAFKFEQVKNNLYGIDISMQPIRYYPFNELGSSFIGYISKINSSKQEAYEQRGYDVSTDYIGTAGLESAFEDRLKGAKGGTTVKVNKYGRTTEELFKLDSYPGQNMHITVDKTLQAVTEKALADTMKDLQINYRHGSDPVNTKNATRGAAVVLDVNTGAVLAMASNPGYDPNLFAVPGRLTPQLYQQVFSPDLKAFGENYIKNMGLDRSKVTVDTLFPVDSSIKDAVVRKDQYDIYPKPFFNYATSSLIPPGSTFKPLTSIAGLEEGVITPNEKIYDAAVFDEHGSDTNGYTGACWIWNEHHGSHGSINVVTALEKSCNYFFYEVSYRLFKTRGLDTLAEYAWKFGLGVNPKSNTKPATGIEISEKFGQVYNDQSRRNLAAKFFKFGLVETVNRGNYNGTSYKPLVIGDDENDNEALKKGKTQFKKALEDEIMIDTDYKTGYELLKTERLPKYVKALLESYPADLRSTYTAKDIEYNTYAIADYMYFTAKREATTPGNIYDASIGQGMSTFTPLQLTNYIATLVNGGNRYKVHLVDKFTDASGKVIEEFKPEVIEKINLKASTIETVKEGMSKVTSETGTAAGALANFPIHTGGKTGSATFQGGGKQEEIGRTSYGLYLGFAPYDQPEIAVCVIIFDGGHGGYVAPVARAIYETYFRETLKQDPNFKPMFDYTLNP
jgi:penicillin-binding protein 2